MKQETKRNPLKHLSNAPQIVILASTSLGREVVKKMHLRDVQRRGIRKRCSCSNISKDPVRCLLFLTNGGTPGSAKPDAWDVMPKNQITFSVYAETP
jgi:hypothetical protein